MAEPWNGRSWPWLIGMLWLGVLFGLIANDRARIALVDAGMLSERWRHL